MENIFKQLKITTGTLAYWAALILLFLGCMVEIKTDYLHLGIQLLFLEIMILIATFLAIPVSIIIVIFYPKSTMLLFTIMNFFVTFLLFYLILFSGGL